MLLTYTVFFFEMVIKVRNAWLRSIRAYSLNNRVTLLAYMNLKTIKIK